MADYTDIRLIGGTRDDAAGEAFDKIGRVIGMPYPGGAALDRLAAYLLEKETITGEEFMALLSETENAEKHG